MFAGSGEPAAPVIVKHLATGDYVLLAEILDRWER
jgi:hypothetical protein